MEQEPPQGDAKEPRDRDFTGDDRAVLADAPAVLVKMRLPDPVLVADSLPVRQRRPEDLYGALASALGIFLVLLLGVYAHSTTQGVTEDVRIAFSSLIRQLLILPLSVLQGLFVIVAPAAVVLALARRQRFRSILSAFAAGIAASGLGMALTHLIQNLPPSLVDSLTVSTASGSTKSLDVVMLVLAAAFTAAGDGSRMKSIRYSWYGIWFVLVVGVIRGLATVPGILVTVLLGRMVGLLFRWLLGFNDRRAAPQDLVEALLTMGVIPRTVIRTGLGNQEELLTTWRVTESPQHPDVASAQVHPELTVTQTKPVTVLEGAPTHLSSFADRHYLVESADGKTFELHVLDPQRAITETIEDIWSNLRLKGLSRWISPTLKANAERAVLTAYVAGDAGVRTPLPHGVAEAGNSLAVLWQNLPPVSTLAGLAHHGQPISDDLLDQAWCQLLEAHSRGVAHRNLDANTLTVDDRGDLWILDWDQGEVAAGEITQHIDRAQMIAYLALVVGAQRAFDSAKKCFTLSELLAISLVLQPAVLPSGIRGQLRKSDTLDELRSLLSEASELSPAVDGVVPLKLQRFSLRTVIMVVIVVTILVGVIGSLNFQQIADAARDANPWWLLGAFFIGSLTWVSAAMPLVAFAPKKISLRYATIAQMGGSLANVVAPAGVGPAAFNLRFLTKQGIKMPLAVATVTLVQISQFLTSVTLLLVIVIMTGTSLDMPIPTMNVVWGAGVILALVASLLAIPKIRSWLWVKVKPTWEQVYPQFVWIMAHPKELAYAMAGNLLGNLGYIGAFAASLAAFGQYLSPMTVTITFLISTTVGSLVPSPGGIGTVEAALTGGLQVAGVPTAIAFSAAVIYRLVTFYGRIPVGWFAMRYLQKKDLV